MGAHDWPATVTWCRRMEARDWPATASVWPGIWDNEPVLADYRGVVVPLLY